jgi:hypothetical protein
VVEAEREIVEVEAEEVVGREVVVAVVEGVVLEV